MYKIFLLLLSFTLLGERIPMMLQIKSELKIPADFRNGVEEGLLNQNYRLIDATLQQSTLEQMANSSDGGCIDDSCLMNVGQILTAKVLVLIEVTQKEAKRYLFKVRMIDLATQGVDQSISAYYRGSLDQDSKLSDFGDLLITGLFNKEALDKLKERINSSWSFAKASLYFSTDYLSFYETDKLLFSINTDVTFFNLKYGIFYIDVAGFRLGVANDGFKRIGLKAFSVGLIFKYIYNTIDVGVEKFYNDDIETISYGRLSLGFRYPLYKKLLLNIGGAISYGRTNIADDSKKGGWIFSGITEVEWRF